MEAGGIEPPSEHRENSVVSGGGVRHSVRDLEIAEISSAWAALPAATRAAILQMIRRHVRPAK